MALPQHPHEEALGEAALERRAPPAPLSDCGRAQSAAVRRALGDVQNARPLSVRAPPAFHGAVVPQSLDRSPARSRDRLTVDRRNPHGSLDRRPSPQDPPESFNITRGEMTRVDERAVL